MAKELTPNQVVAFNLAQARHHRGWTQEEAAEKLAPYLGVEWATSTFSTAERSVSGGRIRQFDADDLIAFSRAFDLPVLWFLLPPAEPLRHGGMGSQTTTTAVGSRSESFTDFLAGLLPADTGKLDELLEEIERRAHLMRRDETDAQRQWHALRVVRDHAIGLIQALRNAYATRMSWVGDPPKDVVSAVSSQAELYQQASEIIEKLTALGGGDSPPPTRKTWPERNETEEDEDA